MAGKKGIGKFALSENGLREFILANIHVTDTGCWEWPRISKVTGYGIINWRKKPRRAHRLAWILFCGPIPDNKPYVLHTCDNRPCINYLDHLYCGTQADNGRDMVLRGRSASGDRSPARLHPQSLRRGERHPGARLTDEKVRELRALAVTLPIIELARRFHIDRKTVRSAIRGTTWSHVDA